MESQVNTDDNKNRGLYWLICLGSLAATILLLLFYSQFFWVALPFFLTYFVKAIGMI